MSPQVQSEESTSTRPQEAASSSSLPEQQQQDIVQQQQDRVVISESEVVFTNIEPTIENIDWKLDNTDSLISGTLLPMFEEIQNEFFSEEIDEGYVSDVESDIDIYLNDVTDEVSDSEIEFDLNPQSYVTEEKTERETTQFKEETPFDDITNHKGNVSFSQFCYKVESRQCKGIQWVSE